MYENILKALFGWQQLFLNLLNRTAPALCHHIKTNINLSEKLFLSLLLGFFNPKKIFLVGFQKKDDKAKRRVEILVILLFPRSKNHKMSSGLTLSIYKINNIFFNSWCWEVLIRLLLKWYKIKQLKHLKPFKKKWDRLFFRNDFCKQYLMLYTFEKPDQIINKDLLYSTGNSIQFP